MKPTRQGLSTVELFRTFLPLSLSDMIMVLAAPLTGAVLGRLADPAIHLAAQGVALSMAIVLESPIIMMLQAATAAAGNAAAYRALGSLMWLWNGFVTLLYALIAFTPAYDWVTRVALGLPPDVAGAARPAFAILLLWPAAIGVRRYMQGQLIYHRRSRDIMLSGFVRLGTLVVMLLVGAGVGMPGASVAALAAVGSVIGEAAAVGLFTRRLRRRLVGGTAPGEERSTSVPLRLGPLFWWYLPLAGTQVLVWLVRPLLTGGIARADLAMLSLAAWPIAWSSVNVAGNGTRMMQQLTIGMVRDRESHHRIRSFAVLVGFCFSALLILVAFTPLSGLYLRSVLGMSPELAAVARPVLMLAVLLPLQISLQNWLQGLLVQKGHTGLVNLGAFLGGSVTVGLVYAGALAWRLPGASLAAGASGIGLLVELAFLWYVTGPTRQRLEIDLESLARGVGSG